MAIARLSVGVGPKGKAGPHAMYIAREGKYEKDDSDLEKLEAVGHGNMPEWAKTDPNFFWKMSDDKERKNGTSYREHVIALPRELTAEQRQDLIDAWIEQEIGDKHAYQYAIHNPLALDGQEQPHCHLMFSERTRDGIERDPDAYFKRYNSKKPERGGAKKANTPKMSSERKLELKEQRDRWEKLCNSHLELAESDARISMKSLADQGIEREPINLSMQQIKTAKIKEIYTDLLSAEADYESAKIDSLSIDVANELSSIKMSEKYNEQADQAIARSKRIVNNITKAAKSTAQENERLSQRISRSKQRLESSKQVSTVSDQAINNSKRVSADADRAIISSKQAITRRLAQRQQELERISKRPVSELLRLNLRVVVVSEYGSKLKDTVARVNDSFYDLYMQAKREKMQLVISNKDSNGKLTNPETIENKTAQAIERFMMRKESLSSINILSDFDSNMSIKDFTQKYSLECDISDLKRLDELYPPVPVAEHVQDVKANTALNLEQKQRADNSYDNSPNF